MKNALLVILGMGIGVTGTIFSLKQGFKSAASDLQSNRENHDVIFESREEANKVFDSLDELLDQYKSVSVADLHDLIGETTTYTNNGIGWTDLSSTRISKIGINRYVLRMPKAKKLK